MELLIEPVTDKVAQDTPRSVKVKLNSESVTVKHSVETEKSNDVQV